MTQLPAGVLWDMDGTIVDTEPYWFAAQTDLVAAFGGTWTFEDGLTLVGSGLWHSAAVLQDRGVEMDSDAIVELLSDRVLERVNERVPWRPGARQLLSELRSAGIPTALVTMSIRRMAEHIASVIPFDAFDAVIAGDDGGHAKPHPEPYLRGAAALGVEIGDCVAFEDSSTGLAAAVASGAVSIGVPLHNPLAEGLGYEIWPTLEGRTLADVAAHFAIARRQIA
ncbi:HAD family hydrolase [soil metagenome]